MHQAPLNLALALTGASGAPYFLRLIERLQAFPELRLHLICSEGGRRVLAEECERRFADLNLPNAFVHDNKNIGASIASGSFPLDAMIVLPCSQNTVSAIAAGLAHTLILRAAAVQLKERRKLVLVPREAPLSLINLRALTAVAEAGALVLPASPAFYHKPQSLTDLLDSVVDRVLDHAGVRDPQIKRWQG